MPSTELCEAIIKLTKAVTNDERKERYKKNLILLVNITISYQIIVIIFNHSVNMLEKAP